MIYHHEIEVAFKINGGMCSGTSGTAEFNSINNQNDIGYGAATTLVDHLTYDHSQLAKIESVSRLQVITYGDDSTISVPLDMPSITMESMTEGMGKLGITFTPEDKSDTAYNYRSITEGSFLQRTAYLHDISNEYEGMLNLSIILEMVCWTTKNAPPNALGDTIEIACKELAARPRQDFNHWFPIIRKAAWEKAHYRVKMSTYEQYFFAYKSIDATY